MSSDWLCGEHEGGPNIWIGTDFNEYVPTQPNATVGCNVLCLKMAKQTAVETVACCVPPANGAVMGYSFLE